MTATIAILHDLSIILFPRGNGVLPRSLMSTGPTQAETLALSGVAFHSTRVCESVRLMHSMVSDAEIGRGEEHLARTPQTAGCTWPIRRRLLQDSFHHLNRTVMPRADKLAAERSDQAHRDQPDARPEQDQNRPREGRDL